MKTQNEIEITRNAYLGCRNALVQQLGTDATIDDFIGILALMLRTILSQNGTLGMAACLDNCNAFSELLKSLVTDSQ
ncbi:hypothetical protein METHB2_790011 [Candidatus Methylobacter favarea]|uniref:Uncharacterized protein n=1 Tax=Candidatus Methylobacter favarea TaxID=2707345 RepID=A0A8S0YAW4_9GAMM|nr:hypothetical protein [Candidatus Methylobacter favarea]CAA9892677.1 hypothetical protein METHB2_790011 [Candidatus Methylobacter favarea]